MRSLLALALLLAPCLCQWGLSSGAENVPIPAAVLNATVVLSSNDTAPAPQYPIGAVKGPFAKPVGRLFEIDGQVTYWSGANAWWIGHLSKNEDVDIVMKQIADTQYKVIRVWAFGDVDDETFPLANATDPRRVWYQYFNDTGSYINYGEDGLQRLDYAVSSAERHGVKLVLVFVNEWSDWGGMDLYTKHFSWPEWVAWFDNPLAQAVYKRWVKILVERYRDSPAVFSWELANEPRCYGCNMDVIGHWAGNMSEYIKSMDPNHMVALGDEGWFNWPNGHYSDAVPSGVSDTATDLSTAYAGFDGIDFVKNMYNPGLDYAVFHLYPSTWNYNDTWGNLWIEQHDDAGKQANFPVVLEEYGCNQPNNHTVPEAMWQEVMLRSGIAGDQVWQFGPYGTSVDVAAFGDPNSIYVNDPEYEGLARQHAANMLAKPVHIIRQ